MKMTRLNIQFDLDKVLAWRRDKILDRAQYMFDDSSERAFADQIAKEVRARARMVCRRRKAKR
jgi:hypothetical protein